VRNVWRQVDGGSISAVVRNAVISAVVTVRPDSTQKSMHWKQDTPSWPVLNPCNTGFMTTERERS
jgi:hypothetical protein